MATIATAQFSSDTDDESATISDTSSDDELDDKYEVEEEKPEKQNIEAVKSVVGAMVEDALVALEHVPTVSHKDPLLVYQKPVAPAPRQPSTVTDVLAYLERCAGTARPSQDITKSITAFKERVRSENDQLSASSVTSKNLLLKDDEEGPFARLQQDVMYGGRVYRSEKMVPRGSAEYQRHLKTQTLGSGLSSLDRLLRQHKGLQTINSIEKSRSDWTSYKAACQLSEELDVKKRDGYLSTQSFLASVDDALYNQSLEARKRKRMLETQNNIR